MKIMNGMTVTLVSLMASGAMAAPTVTKKKIIQKKPVSRQVVTTKKTAKQDHLTSPQSSAISASNATISMPSLTAGTSAATAPRNVVAKKRFIDNVRAGVLLEYYGASIADPLSGQQPNKETGYSEGEAPQELDTRITLGYAVTNNLTVSYNAYFWSYADAGGDKGETFGFRPADSYLKFGFGKFYQSGNFKWNGDLRFYPGLGEAGTRLPLYVRTGQNFTYSLTPRLTLATYSSLRYYHRTESAYNREDRDKTGNRHDFRVTIGPAIEYQALDSVGFALSYNMDYAHARNNNTFAPTQRLVSSYNGAEIGAMYGAYFELGSSIDITKWMNLNPYVDMFTHSFNVEAMQLGANLNFTVL